MGYAYRSVLIGRVFVIRWFMTPEPIDMKNVAKEIVARREAAGQQLIHFAIIPSDVGAPTSDSRKEMGRLNGLWTQHCDAVHCVISGSGFKHAILRSVVSAVALALQKRGFVTIHRSIEDAFRALGRIPGLEVTSIRTQLTKLGMLADVP